MTDPAIEELADEVRAGLDADEQAARACIGVTALARMEHGRPVPRWVAGPDARIEDTDNIVRVKYVWARERGHILRHDPARVLADVATKRALLDEVLGWKHHVCADQYYTCLAATMEHDGGVYGDGNVTGSCGCGRDERVLAVLQRLAQPYQAGQ